MDKDDLILGNTTRELLEKNLANLEHLARKKIRMDLRETNPTGNLVTRVDVYLYDKSNTTYEKMVASFSISYLPSCSWIVLFHNVEVYPDFRNKGIGKYLHTLRIQIAKISNGTLAMATVERDNYREQGILEKNGWKKMLNFKRKTWNKVLENDKNVTLWVKELY